jgi:hypothetical protein
MTNVKARYEQAMKYAREREYESALAVLESLDHPKARELEQRIHNQMKRDIQNFVDRQKERELEEKKQLIETHGAAINLLDRAYELVKPLNGDVSVPNRQAGKQLIQRLNMAQQQLRQIKSEANLEIKGVELRYKTIQYPSPAAKREALQERDKIIHTLNYVKSEIDKLILNIESAELEIEQLHQDE